MLPWRAEAELLYGRHTMIRAAAEDLGLDASQPEQVVANLINDAFVEVRLCVLVSSAPVVVGETTGCLSAVFAMLLTLCTTPPRPLRTRAAFFLTRVSSLHRSSITALKLSLRRTNPCLFIPPPRLRSRWC